MNMIAEGNLQQLLLVAAIAIMIVVLMRRSNRYFSRQDRVCPTTGRASRPKTDALASAQASDELARWEVRMHDLARDLSGPLDSKMVALEHLIRDADRAAARLERALAAAEPGDSNGQSPGLASSPPEATERTEPVAADQAEKLKSAGPADSMVGASDSGSPGGSTRDRRYEEIYTLSDYGLEPSEIAQRVESPVGEVELILGLRGGR
jgi:hypothetical protein